MRYCINPWCSDRQNPEEKDFCQACDTPLLIQDRYWLVRPLRELSEAYITEIFEAEDCECQLNTLQRRKVIKVLKSSNSKLICLLKQEAQVLNALSLPKRGGIPQVESDGYFSVEINNPYRKLHCLTMEFIEGKDLEQWLSNQGNQPIDEELARDWLRQIAATLERVHKQGIVHKDIKPSNIMLRNGQLVLIDFGIVKVVGQD
jgi:serine/threonine protein kinase